MNDVVISATLKGNFQEISNDGVQFTLVTRGGRSNSLDEFTVLAYGNSAKFLQQHAQSGSRVVAQGRLSSEKLDTEVYHTAITVNRVLSVGPAESGIDHSRVVVSGTASSEGVREVGNGKKLASFNIANAREYVSRSGENKSYTTYLSATLWGDRAEELVSQGLIPTQEANVTIEGILKPRSYENNNGQTVNKVDIWVDDIVFAQAHFTQEPKPRQETREVQERQPQSAPQPTKQLDSSPF